MGSTRLYTGRADERLDADSPDVLREQIRHERRANELLRMTLHLQAKMPGIDSEWCDSAARSVFINNVVASRRGPRPRGVR